MKDFQKLLYSRDGSVLNLSFDLLKMEGSNRVVTGFATLDNIDFGSDIVSAGASLKAFSNFRGNVRVQHDKLRPVGRVLDFQPSTYFDEKTQKEYNGIKVAVYISEGAEDIWKMCLDGTLSGFSIGGAVTKASKVYKEDIGKSVQVIDEYALLELSLVDSPMNGLANVYSIHKSLDTIEVDKGYDTLSLFYCGTDGIARKSKGEEESCPVCTERMANFGETNEDEDIAKSLEKAFMVLKNDTNGGHPHMEKDNDTSGAENAPETQDVENEVVSEEATTTEVVETPTEEPNVTEVTEVTTSTEVESEGVLPKEEAKEEENDVSRLLSELRELLEESSKETVKSQDQLREEIKEVSAELNNKLADLADRYTLLEKATGDIKEKLNSASEELEETKKRLDVVADATPIRKSLDSAQVHEDNQPEEKKPLFKGVFSGSIV